MDSGSQSETYPAYHKEYGFPYHLTPKILKEIIAKRAKGQVYIRMNSTAYRQDEY